MQKNRAGSLFLNSLPKKLLDKAAGLITFQLRNLAQPSCQRRVDRLSASLNFFFHGFHNQSAAAITAVLVFSNSKNNIKMTLKGFHSCQHCFALLLMALARIPINTSHGMATNSMSHVNKSNWFAWSFKHVRNKKLAQSSSKFCLPFPNALHAIYNN